MRQELNRVPNLPTQPRLRKDDWLGAVGVFLIVVLSTFPVAIPFALIREARLALRVSNGIAIVMLFLAGYAFGRHAGHRPLGMGLTMVILGVVLVAITISLGG
jgi:VIT1/CCC1 family predicted Fe2+/Mn2+ transporter